MVQIHFEAGAKELGGWQQNTPRYPFCCACLPVEGAAESLRLDVLYPQFYFGEYTQASAFFEEGGAVLPRIVPSSRK